MVEFVAASEAASRCKVGVFSVFSENGHIFNSLSTFKVFDSYEKKVPNSGHFRTCSVAKSVFF